MPETPDIDQIDKINEQGLSARQLIQMQEEVRRSRNGLLRGVSLVGGIIAIAWAVVVWFGFDSSLQSRGPQLVTEFLQQGMADLVAEQLAEEPGELADAMRGTIITISDSFVLRSDRNVEDAIGNHDFCALTGSGERSLTGPEKACRCWLDNNGDRGWRLLLTAEQGGGNSGCDCQATCFNFASPEAS